MTFKRIAGASLKAEVFLFYALVDHPTFDFPAFEQDVEEFREDAIKAVQEVYGHDAVVDLQGNVRERFVEKVDAQIRILASGKAFEARQELVDEGFLWKVKKEKHTDRGKYDAYQVGLTDKGKYWAPKYIETFGMPTVSKI